MWNLFSSSTSSNSKASKDKEPKKLKHDSKTNPVNAPKTNTPTKKVRKGLKTRRGSSSGGSADDDIVAGNDGGGGKLDQAGASIDTSTGNIDSDEEEEDMVAEVDENERLVQGKWSSRNLSCDDPKPYVCSTMESDAFPDPPIADGWKYSGPWCVA
jgi:hypothetical protein